MVRALRLRAVPALLATAILVAGCGSAGETTATTPAGGASPTSSVAPSNTPAPLPSCAAVWRVRRILPARYDGCIAGGVTFSKRVHCETGQQLFSYQGRFFAVPGGPIFSASGALAEDPEYRRMLRACTA